MITSDQLRAARGLLNISQDDLAKKTGVAVTSLRQFELGKTLRLQQKTETALMDFFMPLVEFIGTRGVALRQDSIRILEGAEAFRTLLEDVTFRLHGLKGAEALFFSLEPSPVTEEIATAWRTLIGSGVQCRHLGSREGCPQLFESRTPPTNFSGAALQAIYGDSVAQRINENQILLTRSPLLAETLRNAFYALWPLSTLHEAEGNDTDDDEPRRRIA